MLKNISVAYNNLVYDLNKEVFCLHTMVCLPKHTYKPVSRIY